MSVITSGAASGLFSYAGLQATPDIVKRYIWESKWGLNRRQTGLVSTLNMIDNKGAFGGKSSAPSSKVHWAIGDYFNEDGALGASHAANPAASTPAAITLDTEEYRTGDMILIHQLDGASAHIQWGLVRILTDTSSYTCETIETSTGSSITFADASSFKKLASATDYHAVARKLKNARGSFIVNYMQRTRDTSGVGNLTVSNDVIADHSLEHNLLMAQRNYSRKMNLALHYNTVAAQASATGEDYGVAGGLQYFYNPNGLGAAFTASTAYTGQNMVITGTSFAIDSFESWVAGLTEYGGETKLVFANKLMFFEMYNEFRDKILIRREAIKGLDLLNPSMWEALTITTPGGEIQLILDSSADVAIEVKNNVSAATTFSISDYWCVAVDPSMIKLIYMDVKNEGVKTPQVRNIEQLRNASVSEAEIDSVWTLAMKDPRSGGYFAIKNDS